MKLLRVTFALVACSLVFACSKRTEQKAESERAEEHSAIQHEEGEEGEIGPENDEIGEDCVGFLRATRATKVPVGTADCPACPASDVRPEVLHFRDFAVERKSCSETNCSVEVTIKALFNPSTGGRIVGGLTGWISPAQKEQYARGETPAGLQTYKVHVIYRRDRGVWRAVEFN